MKRMKTNMAQTSLLAHEKHERSGAMGEQEAMVYAIVANSEGPITNKEIADRWYRTKGTLIDPGSVAGRVNALKKKGLIEVYEQRHCGITGQMANAVRRVGV